MKSMFERESSGILMGLAWGAAGLVVGAAAACLLTPKTGAEVRKLLASLVTRKREAFDELEEDQRAAMENEGGVGHAVTPPAMSDSRAH